MYATSQSYQQLVAFKHFTTAWFLVALIQQVPLLLLVIHIYATLHKLNVNDYTNWRNKITGGTSTRPVQGMKHVLRICAIDFTSVLN